MTAEASDIFFFDLNKTPCWGPIHDRVQVMLPVQEFYRIQNCWKGCEKMNPIKMAVCKGGYHGFRQHFSIFQKK